MEYRPNLRQILRFSSVTVQLFRFPDAIPNLGIELWPQFRVGNRPTDGNVIETAVNIIVKSEG